MGVRNTDASAAGPVWAKYMKRIHQDLPPQDFSRSDQGIVTVKVCRESGLLPTSDCGEPIEEIFIAGTEPDDFCDIHGYNKKRNADILDKMSESLYTEDITIDSAELDWEEDSSRGPSRGPSSSEDPLGDLDLDLDLDMEMDDNGDGEEESGEKKESGEKDDSGEPESSEYPDSIDILD